MAGVAYVDSSAIVKTIIKEPQSAALRRQLRQFDSHVSSGLARTEVIRAVRRADIEALPRAYDALGKITFIEVNAVLLDAAGQIEPAAIRSLDAIHLAAARLVADSLDALFTYDTRMTEAAKSLGFAVLAPQ